MSLCVPADLRYEVCFGHSSRRHGSLKLRNFSTVQLVLAGLNIAVLYPAFSDGVMMTITSKNVTAKGFGGVICCPN